MAATSHSPEVGSKRLRDEKVVADAAALLAPVGHGPKTVLTCESLEQALMALGGSNADSSPASASQETSDAGLYFAGKWLDADRPLSDYVGRNEKSKVKVTYGAMQLDGSAGGPAMKAADESAGSTPAPPGGAALSAATGTALAASSSTPLLSLSAFFRDRVNGEARAGRAHVPDDDAAGEATGDDFSVLSARQLDALGASSELQAAIRDPRLEEVLRHVDSAPTREGALRRLEIALKADPAFEAFALQALRVIGRDVPRPDV